MKNKKGSVILWVVVIVVIFFGVGFFIYKSNLKIPDSSNFIDNQSEGSQQVNSFAEENQEKLDCNKYISAFEVGNILGFKHETRIYDTKDPAYSCFLIFEDGAEAGSSYPEYLGSAAMRITENPSKDIIKMICDNYISNEMYQEKSHFLNIGNISCILGSGKPNSLLHFHKDGLGVQISYSSNPSLDDSTREKMLVQIAELVASRI
ncbi:hypothetical protein A3A03_01965 [Candidatus Nomurabacteria bacterium RIFCSPLOWO2_01_FULL_40_18]|uniref:Uncharacterized protein n=1 Tax=Candidatus Nomurabacteria bacterium RIFCSPLOWO2_01_FULL_40_18 TaxID=1801773 RepID=A0A1F6XI82_9BACT|nr:MAG: hypothetical protein A3A03_01965 [Candidatus Nomurabacteria bacterium RIFCSPLOWO2_01_FULL_40_18]